MASPPFVILDDLPPEHDQVQCQLDTEKAVEEGEICSDDEDKQSKNSTKRSRNHSKKSCEWDFSERKDLGFDVEDGVTIVSSSSDEEDDGDDTLKESYNHPQQETKNTCNNESQHSGEDTSEGYDSGEMQPTIVPRRRGFWDHDNRFPDISVETSHHRTKRYKVWKQPRKVGKWENDCYDEIKQAPKEDWEREVSSKQVKKWRKYGGSQGKAQDCAEGSRDDLLFVDIESKMVSEKGIEDQSKKVSERGIVEGFLEEGEICSDDEENSIHNVKKRKLGDSDRDKSKDADDDGQHPYDPYAILCNSLSSKHNKCTDDGNNNIEKSRSNWSNQRSFHKEDNRIGQSRDDEFTFSHDPNWSYFRLRASAQSYE